MSRMHTNERLITHWQNLWDAKEAATIYYIGFGISLIALIIALWIFFYFK